MTETEFRRETGMKDAAKDVAADMGKMTDNCCRAAL